MRLAEYRAPLSYGLLAIPLAALGLPVHLFLPAFLAEDCGFGLGVAGTLIFISRLWDLITDPMAGWLCQRYPRHLPHLITTGVGILLLASLLLFGIPPDTIGIAGSALLLYYAGWTLAQVPYYTWSAALATEQARRQATASREALLLAGMMLGMVVPALSSDNSAANSLWLLTLVALVLFIPALPLLWRYAPHPSSTPPATTRSSIRALWHNSAFKRLLLVYGINFFASSIPAALFLFYVRHVLQTPDNAPVLLLAYFAAAVLAMPLWLYLAKRIGNLAAWRWSIAVACLVFPVAFFLSAGDSSIFLIITAITGACLGADMVLPGATLAEIVARSREQSTQQGGFYYACWIMATKLALAGSALALWLLSASGFDTADTNHTASALSALAGLYALLPVTIKILALILCWKFSRIINKGFTP